MELTKSKTDSKNSNVTRKPSLKLKKAPEVRQTLTSYKRMLKANPLLEYEKAGIDVDKLIAAKQEQLHNSKNTKENSQQSEFKKPDSKPPRPLQRSCSLKFADKPTFYNSKIVSSTPVEKNSKNKPQNSHKAPLVKGANVQNKNVLFHNGNINTTNHKDQKSKPENKPKNPVRRSLSSGHINRKKGGYTFNPKACYTKSDLTQSMENVTSDKNTYSAHPTTFSPIHETSNREQNNFVFKTPSAYERRSISHFTPKTGNRKSIVPALRISTPIHSLDSLQERLNQWLKKRGKSLSSFHHLKCFGLHSASEKIKQDKNVTKAAGTEGENKENIEPVDSSSYEDLKIGTTQEPQIKIVSPDNEKIEPDNVQYVAKEALMDLHKLIIEGYPREQCESWLDLIRSKCCRLEDEPQYWECRAAIEQSDGNIRTAVECYRTAIVQGAEINTVDKSLDQLLQKFSLLDIKADHTEKSDKERERILNDARNVFKSSIIQFAVAERKLKRHEKKPEKTLVVTPVRRSTRLSRSGYVLTPGVKMCSSLKELDAESVGTMSFCKNKALC